MMNNNPKEMDNDNHGIPVNTAEFQIQTKFPFEEDDDNVLPLALSLSLPSSSTMVTGVLSSMPSPPLLTGRSSSPPIAPVEPLVQPALSFFFPEHPHGHYMPSSPDVTVPVISTSLSLVPPAGAINQTVYRQEQPGPSRRTRHRKNQSNEKKSDIIAAPYPWATDRRATVHKYSDLLTKRISIIEGEVRCNKCQKKYQMRFNLTEKFDQVGIWFANHKDSMHDRAPERWKNPVLPNCEHCNEENCVKPTIPGDMEKVNWLFLLLGEMIGLCTLKQLRYFCMHTDNHRTGAKDRLIYQTYLTLCKQLFPEGPF